MACHTYGTKPCSLKIEEFEIKLTFVWAHATTILDAHVVTDIWGSIVTMTYVGLISLVAMSMGPQFLRAMSSYGLIGSHLYDNRKFKH